MLVESFLLAAISLLLSLHFTLLFKIIALKKRLFLRHGIPSIGGLAVAISFTVAALAGLLSRGIFLKSGAGIIGASLLMLIFGMIDDWRELSITAKVVTQIIATGVLFISGVKTQIVYIGPFLNALITFVWVIGITNAFNHLDVMDGLASGAALVAASAFLLIAFLLRDQACILLSLALLGACFGFLFFNFPPAKAYLGNAGSHFLGFVLAAISLNLSYAPLERKIALLTPLLILGFPIFDTAFLVLIRLSRKKVPYKKSNDHLVLRFLSAGVSKRRTLLINLLFAVSYSLCGVLVSRVSNLIGACIVGAVVFISLSLAYRMGKVCIND